MQQPAKTKFKRLLSWVLWILIIQLVLVNISAAIYAYRFTHLEGHCRPYQPARNIFIKTWRLFTGPRLCKTDLDTSLPTDYERMYFSLANGNRIEGWYSAKAHAKGCVVFFHGITVNKSLLLNEANQFRQWGYNVLLIDFRSHGNSTGNKTSWGFYETEEVEKAFAWAKAKNNKRIVLYGSSLGAGVILKATAEKKVQPAAIIADMPFASLQHHLEGRARTLGFPAQPFAFFVTLWIGLENGFNGFSHRVDKYAAKVNCPVLLQWGDRDEYVLKEETDAIYKALPSQKKRLAVYNEVNHQSFLNASPYNWEREIKSFMATVP